MYTCLESKVYVEEIMSADQIWLNWWCRSHCVKRKTLGSTAFNVWKFLRLKTFFLPPWRLIWKRLVGWAYALRTIGQSVQTAKREAFNTSTIKFWTSTSVGQDANENWKPLVWYGVKFPCFTYKMSCWILNFHNLGCMPINNKAGQDCIFFEPRGRMRPTERSANAYAVTTNVY